MLRSGFRGKENGFSRYKIRKKLISPLQGISAFLFWLFSKRLLFLKRNDLRLIGAEVRDSCGSSGTGETPQAFTPRRLTARPAESVHLKGKSTTPHYLLNSNIFHSAKRVLGNLMAVGKLDLSR
ncbi:hypothetical protein EI200_12315 [Peribacillus simplex]|nr:hypothetical protein EI200_12315 [Peribacillus simplex]